MGLPERGAITIHLRLAPVGNDHEIVIRPGLYAGEQALHIHDRDAVDAVLYEFLKARGYGHLLERWTPQPDARGNVDVPRPVDTPPYVRAWFSAAVAAGELIVAEQLPAPEARQRLREAAGLSRSQVAEQLGVHRSAVRMWEIGARVPQEPHRAAYVELLASWREEPAVRRDLDEMPAGVDPGAHAYEDLRRAQAANPIPVRIGRT